MIVVFDSFIVMILRIFLFKLKLNLLLIEFLNFLHRYFLSLKTIYSCF